MSFVYSSAMKKKHAYPLIVLTLVMMVVVGCGVGQSASTSPTPALAPTLDTVIEEAESEVSATSTSTVEPKPTQLTQEQKAISLMWQMLDQFGSPNKAAVIAAGLNGHMGLVPVLVEVASRTFDPEAALTIAEALEKLTGETVGGDFVLRAPWYSWMGRQDPPQVELDEYDDWKSELLSTMDPSFGLFVYKDVPTRIPLWTVDWGGVLRDGIPQLEFPKTKPGAQVRFLNSDELVFGVTINGESRAYPHRIMGWHELSNDRLGGELIIFVF